MYVQFILPCWPHGLLLRGKDCVEAAVCLPTPCGFKLVLTLTVSKHLDVIKIWFGMLDSDQARHTFCVQSWKQTSSDWKLWDHYLPLLWNPWKNKHQIGDISGWSFSHDATMFRVLPAAYRLPGWGDSILVGSWFMCKLCKPRLSLADMLLACFYIVSPVLPSFFKLSKPPLWRAR